MIRDSQPQWQKKSYRSVALVVSAVFFLIVLTGILLVVHGKQQVVDQVGRQSFITEQHLLYALLDEPAQHDDMAQVKIILQHFFEGSPDYVAIHLYGPGEPPLFSAVRPEKEHTLQAEISFGDLQHPVQLILKKNQIVPTRWLPYRGWDVIALIVLGCVVLSPLMWLLIKRFGLDPLRAGVLREQHYYRSLFDQAQEAIFIMSEGGELLRLNNSARRLFKLPARMDGGNLRQFHNKTNWLKVSTFIEKIRQQGHHTETVYLPALDLCVEILGSQIVLEEQTLIQLVILDITEQYNTQQKLKTLQEELERSLDEYRTLFDYSVDGLTVRNLKGELLLCNKSYEEMLGRTFDELNHQHFTKLCDPQEKRALNDKYLQALDGKSILFEFTYEHKDGHQFPVEIRSIVIDYRGESCVLTAVRDISERREKDQRLRELSAVVDYSNDAVMITDDAGKVLAVNKTFCGLSGYSEDEFLNKIPLFLSSERHDRSFYGQLVEQLRDEKRWEGEVWIRHRRGHSLPQWLRIETVEEPDEKTTRYVAVSADLSEEKAWEEKMLQLAQTDPLTGSANRVLFRDRLQQAIKRAQNRKGMAVQVFSLDLDYFKRINDSLGHVAGDRMLIEVASRLKRASREQDTISRLSGDEFAILVTCLNDEVDATRMAQTMLQAISEPMTIDGSELIVSASIGVALYPGDGEDDVTLMANADNAMHQAKRQGRSRMCYFSAELADKAQEYLTIESKLRRALEDDELQLYYQPQVDLSTGDIVAAEALLRWNSAELGWVSPDRMIPVAEEGGLIIPLGRWIIEECCRTIGEYHRNSGNWFPIAVNVSARQFLEPGFAEELVEIVKFHGIPPSVLELELTESMMLDDVSQAVDTMKALNFKGFKIALDDFGTGYTSLAYLKQFPVTKLKLDRAFVTDVHQDVNDAAIAEALVTFTRVMGLSLAAEGIEESVQHEYLNLMGFRYGQGYLFSRPLPKEEFTCLLESKSGVSFVRTISPD